MKVKELVGNRPGIHPAHHHMIAVSKCAVKHVRPLAKENRRNLWRWAFQEAFRTEKHRFCWFLAGGICRFSLPKRAVHRQKTMISSTKRGGGIRKNQIGLTRRVNPRNENTLNRQLSDSRRVVRRAFFETRDWGNEGFGTFSTDTQGIRR